MVRFIDDQQVWRIPGIDIHRSIVRNDTHRLREISNRKPTFQFRTPLFHNRLGNKYGYFTTRIINQYLPNDRTSLNGFSKTYLVR